MSNSYLPYGVGESDKGLQTKFQRYSFLNGTVTAKIGTQKGASWTATLIDDQGESIALPYMVKKKQIYTEHNHPEN